MSQSAISFQIDSLLKRDMERTCHELGMNVATAFTIFARKVTREQRIPFDVSIDPFYSKANMDYLKKVTSEIDSGVARLEEHDLIEV